MRRVDFDFEGRVEGSPGGFRSSLSLSSYIFFGREKRYAAFKVSLLSCAIGFECDFGFVCPFASISRSSIRLPPSLSLRNAHSRLKRPLRHPFHAVRAKVSSSRSVNSRSASVVVKAERELWYPGATAPEYLDGSMAGDYGFDPLRLGANKETLPYLQEAELMNGRWAMYATVGILFTDSTRASRSFGKLARGLRHRL